MPNYHFRELDESIVFAWIERLRDKTSTGHERLVAETSLFSSLRPIASWIAHLPSNPREYDTEQVVNDAICKLFVVYVSNPDFRFRSCGHLVRLLGQITTNERRLEYRRNNRAKRVPQDADGHRLPIESLNLVQCDCPSNSQDTTCECENNELIEHCLRWLCDSNHRRVFLMLMADFTWAEMAMKLNVDRKTIRRWVNEMRRILAPRTSHLAPQTSSLAPLTSSLAPRTSHLKPRTSHLAPRTSSLKPQASHLKPHNLLAINDQTCDSNSLLQRGAYFAVGAG